MRWFRSLAVIFFVVGLSPAALAQSSSFTGFINGFTLTATAVHSGRITPGQTLTGPGLTSNTVILSNGTGTGGIGTYTVSISQTVPSGTVMTGAPAGTVTLPQAILNAPAFSGTLTSGDKLALASGDPSNATLNSLPVTAITGAVLDVLPINVLDKGAKRDLKSGADGTMTSGSATFTSATASFAPTDCNVTHGNGCTGTVDKIITVDYAGGAGNLGTPLSTTIIGYNSSTSVTLAAAASNTVPYTVSQMLARTTTLLPSSNVVGAITGYVPGDTITVAGGTATSPAVLSINGTQVTAAAIVAGGTGGTVGGGSDTGNCTVRGTTGAPSTALAVTTVTITSGIITAIVRHTSRGFYTTNPTDPANEPVTGDVGEDSPDDPDISSAPERASPCTGITGAVMAFNMGPALPIVQDVGRYSVAPTNPVMQASTSGSGTGANFTMTFTGTGYYTYSTDDSGAFSVAIDAANTIANAGGRTCIYVPAGVYGLRANTLPIFARNGCVRGDGSEQSVMAIDAGYSGNVWSWSNAWLGALHFSGTLDNITDTGRAGPSIDGMTIRGDRSSPNLQHAISFFDRNDYVYINDVQVANLPGRCLFAGELLNGSIGQFREGFVDNFICSGTGTAALAAVEIKNTGLSSGPTTFARMSIYGSAGKSLFIHNGARELNFAQLRIEGLQNNLVGNLVQISDPADTINTYQVRFAQLRLTSAAPGTAAFMVEPNASGGMPYAISVLDGMITGGLNYGTGINIQGGQRIALNFTLIGTRDSNVRIAAAPATANYVTISGLTSFTTDVGTFSELLTPLMMVGKPGFRSPLSTSLPYLVSNCQSGSPLTTTAAVETNLASCVLPALKRNDRIEVLATWSWPSSVNTKEAIVRLSTAVGTSGTIFSDFTATTTSSARCKTIIQNTGVTIAQRGSGSVTDNCSEYTATGGTPVTSALNTSNGTTTVNINAIGNGVGETVSLDSYAVWIYPGATQ